MKIRLATPRELPLGVSRIVGWPGIFTISASSLAVGSAARRWRIGEPRRDDTSNIGRIRSAIIFFDTTYSIGFDAKVATAMISFLAADKYHTIFGGKIFTIAIARPRYYGDNCHQKAGTASFTFSHQENASDARD